MVDVETKNNYQDKEERANGKNDHECAGAIGTDGHKPIIDEAHRSTFGEMLSNIKNTFVHSILFGFTGTPIQDVNKKRFALMIQSTSSVRKIPAKCV